MTLEEPFSLLSLSRHTPYDYSRNQGMPSPLTDIRRIDNRCSQGISEMLKTRQETLILRPQPCGSEGIRVMILR